MVSASTILDADTIIYSLPFLNKSPGNLTISSEFAMTIQITITLKKIVLGTQKVIYERILQVYL